MTVPPGTYLGFDYGSKNIGVAVGQSITATANPLSIVTVRQNKPDWDVITQLIQTWRPQALIVGLPLNMDATEHQMTAAAKCFSAQLHHRYGLPVYPADERLSSIEARQRLASQGFHDKEDDPVAAQIILETWFGQQHEHAGNG